MSQTFNFLAPEFITDPYPAYQYLRDEHPLFFDLPTSHWLLSRYEDVFAALRNPIFRSGRVDVLFAKIPATQRDGLQPLTSLLEPRLLFTDGQQHARLRTLISQAFSPRRIEQMRPIVRHAVQELLTTLDGRSELDLIAAFADPLPSRVITRIIGLPAEGFERFKNWTNQIYDFVGVSQVEPAVRATIANRAAAEISCYLQEEIRNRGNDDVDLLGSLLAAQENGERLSRGEIIANVVGLLNAGHETTANLIANGIWLLTKHPQQQRLLRDNPALLPPAIEEIMRFESPVQIVARRSAEPVILHDTQLAAGANLLLLLGSANRDPRSIDRPHQFDIRRAGPRHLAFGFGPHFCIGAALARLMAEEALRALLARWPKLEFAASPRWRASPIFRGLCELPLRVQWQPLAG